MITSDTKSSVAENQSKQIKIDTLKRFRTKLLAFAESALYEEPGVHSMMVRLNDNTNDLSPFCSLMHLFLRLKTVRSSLLTSSKIQSSLKDWNIESGSVPNSTWMEPRMRQFLYWFFHAAHFMAIGKSDEYRLITKLKKWIIADEFAAERDCFMMLNCLTDAFIATTTSSIESVPSGFHGKYCLTRKCVTCSTQSHTYTDFRFIEFNLERIRRFHLYFIPQLPWSKEAKNFPVKMTLFLPIDMKISAIVHLACQIIPSVSPSQWKPFYTKKRFMGYKEMDLDCSLRQLSECVTKICFCQTEVEEFSVIRFCYRQDNSSYYLPIPWLIVNKQYSDFMIENVTTESTQKQNWKSYVFSVLQQYFEIIFVCSDKSVDTLHDFIYDCTSSYLTVKSTKINKDKFNSIMWSQGRDQMRIMTLNCPFFSHLFLNCKQDKSSMRLNDLLSTYFTLHLLSEAPINMECAKCEQKCECTFSSDLFSPPDDLVIYLKQEIFSKKELNIICPEELDLTPVMHDKTQSVRYKLRGILNRTEKASDDKTKSATVHASDILINEQDKTKWMRFTQSGIEEIPNPSVENCILLTYELDDTEDWDCDYE